MPLTEDTEHAAKDKISIFIFFSKIYPLNASKITLDIKIYKSINFYLPMLIGHKPQFISSCIR